MSSSPFEIIVNPGLRDRRRRELATLAIASLALANIPDERFFVFGGNLARRKVERSTNRMVLQRLDADRLAYELERIADWYWLVASKGQLGPARRPTSPPRDVVRDVLASPSWPLPIVEQIVTAPIFAPDGSLQSQPGYHPGSLTYYQPTPGFVLRPVPEHPDQRDVEQARGILLEPLRDFPFVTDADRTHVISGQLTPIVRSLTPGPTPLHVIDAPVKGTGKTLVARTIVYPVVGEAAIFTTEGRGEEEWRKRIGAWLSKAPQVVWIDNVKSKLWSGAFAAALTEDIFSDRLLGRNDITIEYPIRPLWLVTGNNVNLSDEIARRTVPIRLDSQSENPHLRDTATFRHPNLRGWLREHRSEMVWALLVLVRWWQAQGSPMSDVSLGSYESWAPTVGGILEVAGIDGFLTTLDEFYEQHDPETRGWKTFVRVWWTNHRNSTVRPSELLDTYNSLDDDFANLGGGSDRSRTTRLGQRLLQKQNVMYEGKRITLTDNAQGGNRWRLVETEDK